MAASGGICSASAAEFSRELVWAALRFAEPEGGVILELNDLDLLDGPAVAETVNAIRQILGSRRRVQIHHAPQMLAHTLYKAGMLEDGRIALGNPIEEGSTAN
ncbi:MAG: hypothetical protein ACE5JS_15170 [Nitrospinota bacterium]